MSGFLRINVIAQGTHGKVNEKNPTLHKQHRIYIII